MEIFINSIQKKNDTFSNEINEYVKMSKKYANINDIVAFNDRIAKSQSSSRVEALKAYDNIYEPNMRGYCVALDADGKMFDSLEFAKIFEKNASISFFIGGAYGLSHDFKKKVDCVVSLSRLTFAHKIAKLVLFEQIFRALSINAGHPYNK